MATLTTSMYVLTMCSQVSLIVCDILPLHTDVELIPWSGYVGFLHTVFIPP